MCGIIGGTISKEQAKKSLAKMKRGNDGDNIIEFKDYKITFGFQRHAIIAPEDTKSMQPIISSDGKVALIMNGEVFRFRQFKEALQNSGVNFTSDGDAEVLLQLYLNDEQEFYQAIGESMCAVGLTDFRDTKDAKIIITRDWIGELPLHYIYSQQDKTFVFSSEIKSLIDIQETSFDTIRSVEPSTYITLHLDDFSLVEQTYEQNVVSNQYENIQSIGKELRKRMEEESRVRCIADVPICCLLSGGVDSTVTLYLVKKYLAEKSSNLSLYCFHVEGHPIDEYSDLFHARKVAEYFGLKDNLKEVYISEQNIIDAIPEVIYALEDKRCKDFNVYTAIYNYFLAKQIASDGYKVAFNGEGSDEFHGSYGSWGSFVIDPNEIIKPEFRKKMASNLHKGVLMRTSKVMMYAGPVEMRSIFLSPSVANFIMNIPPKYLRQGDVWKMPLVEAFKDVIPSEILSRPKQRPQDVTGIMNLKNKIIKKYKEFGDSDAEIFKNLFLSKFKTDKSYEI
jgi:asparagine synthase (glutamine-hydrolysing)